MAGPSSKRDRLSISSAPSFVTTTRKSTPFHALPGVHDPLDNRHEVLVAAAEQVVALILADEEEPEI
jgi:hypothetical protein